MLPDFDPVGWREFWLELRLKHTMEDEPPKNHVSHAPYASGQVSSLFNGCIVGLSKELKSTAEKHIIWMESELEPDSALYEEAGLSRDAWRDDLYSWRRSLGVCKWLSRGDLSYDDLTAAAAADWQGVELASPNEASLVRASRRKYMSVHLATALAADAPLIGLKVYEAAGMKLPMAPASSPVRFGHWACRHLIDGGTRDEAFVARGRDMLTANLLPNFYQAGGMIEPALWLKAIYFDSGVAQTPEQTIARAYDSMPGIPRPDFILP